MTKAAHTPGPWELYSEHPAEQYVDQIRIDSDERKPIFRIHHDREIGHEEARANARLIMTAPDLLEAAEKVIASWERGDLAAAVRQLDAAIAKAKDGSSDGERAELFRPPGRKTRLEGSEPS